MEVANSLKSVNLKHLYEGDTLKTWLVPSLAGLAITGGAYSYWCYKKRRPSRQTLNSSSDAPEPMKLRTRILLHPRPDGPEMEQNPHGIASGNVSTGTASNLNGSTSNLMGSRSRARYSEEDEEVYSILQSRVKKTSSLPDNQEQLLSSTKHLSRGDLPDGPHVVKCVSSEGPADLNHFSAGDKPSTKDKKKSGKKSKKASDASKLHSAKSVNELEKATEKDHLNKEKAAEKEQDQGRVAGEIKTETGVENMILSGPENSREHFRIISLGDTVTITKTSPAGCKTRFNFHNL